MDTPLRTVRTNIVQSIRAFRVQDLQEAAQALRTFLLALGLPVDTSLKSPGASAVISAQICGTLSSCRSAGNDPGAVGEKVTVSGLPVREAGAVPVAVVTVVGPR